MPESNWVIRANKDKSGLYRKGILGTPVLNNLLNSSRGRSVQRGIFHFLIQKTSLNFLKNLHPSTLTHCHTVLLQFLSYLKLSYMSIVYLVIACLPLFENWKLLSVPDVSQHLKLPIAPGRVQNYLQMEGKGRKGGENREEKCLLSTYCTLCVHEFISCLVDGTFIFGSAYFYIQGPTLRMFSDLPQGHSAQTSMSPLTSSPLHSRSWTVHLPSRNLIYSSS